MKDFDTLTHTDVRSVLADMKRHRILEKIWDHDHTVWKPEPKEITNRLGWLRLHETMPEHLPSIETFVDQVRAAGYTRALLLGMGGSSLAPEVLRRTFGVRDGYLDLAVLDSTDPGAVLDQAERLDPATTLFIVSTKSGGTVETLSLFKYFYNRTADHLGGNAAGRHFVAITDPGSGLEALARQYQFRTTFLNDPDIGGRYSALSSFGLVPAALIGLDVRKLLVRATTAASGCRSYRCPDNRHINGPCLGAILGQSARTGRDKLTFLISRDISGFADWAEQLIAESTGKEGTGILPVVHESPGPPEVYANDRLFIHLRLAGDDRDDVAIAALEQAGQPVLRIHLQDAYDLGGQFFLWEFATAVAGSRMGINPFDQPNVEAAKVQARALVDTYIKEGKLPEGESFPPDPDLVKSFLAGSEPGAYICLQAYVNPTDETFSALQGFRRRLRDTYRLATTVGFGPRFLHSTGQLHKGDAGAGLFLQFIAHDDRDVPIPDEAGSPASFMTFGVLKAAQALGDRQALLDAGRRIMTIHLHDDVADGLRKLHDAFQ